MFDGYTRAPWLDIPMHIAGGLAITFAFDGLLTIAEERSLLEVPGLFVRLLLLACLVTTAATGWEFVEFVSDTLFDTEAQKGLEDTLFDIFLGIVGGIGFALFTLGRNNRTTTG